MPSLFNVTPFRRANGGHVSLAVDAVDTMMVFRQHERTDPERGGMLLGRLLVGTEDVVIDAATRPNPSDAATRFSFRRGRRHAQQLVDEAWERSSGTRIYLGEWHTHPELAPEPSPQDIRNWIRIGEKAVVESESLFFVIVGQRTIGAWELLRNRSSLVRLVAR